MKYNNMKLKAVLAALGLSVIAPQASGQVLEEIIVTAQKRAQDLGDVPLSMQAVTGEALEKQAIFDMKGLAERLPNVFLSTTPGPSSIAIRGVGTGSTNSAAEQAVGVYVDGLYVGRGHQFNSPFSDIERVEILKGPQGVLQGKNSVAGAVVVTTARPTKEFEAKLTAGYELENEGYNLQGMVSGPLTDNLSGRLLVQSNLSGGYLDSTSRTAFDGTTQILGEEDQNEDEFSTLRASLLWEPSDDLSLFGKVEVGERKTSGLHFGPSNIQPGAAGDAIRGLFESRDPNFGFITDGVISNGRPTEFNPATSGYSVTDQELGIFVDSASFTGQVDWSKDWGTLTSITTYSEFDQSQLLSNSMAPLDWLTSIQQDGNGGEEFDQTTQEFRLVSPGGETVDYIIGAYYMDRTILNDGNRSRVNIASSGLPAFAFFSGFPIEVAPGVVIPVNIQPFLNAESVKLFKEETQSVSVFGQATWNVSDLVRVNLGARYTDETKDLVYERATEYPLVNPFFNPITGAIFGTQQFVTADLPVSKVSDTNFDPSASVQWDVSDNVMLYTSLTKATKAGGFNASSNVIANTSFRPEEARGFEAGLKGSFLDGRLFANVAVYQTKYDDLQVSALDTNTNSFFFKNAAEATTQGIEADFRYAVSDSLEIGGAMAIADATYDDFPGATCSAGLSEEADCVNDTRNAAGDKLRFAPDASGNLYADYLTDLSNGMVFGLRGDVIYSADYFWGGQNDIYQSQDSYVKFDVSASITSADGSWKVSLVGRNLSDETTVSFGGGTPFFGGSNWSNVDAPRQVFLTGEFNWN